MTDDSGSGSLLSNRSRVLFVEIGEQEVEGVTQEKLLMHHSLFLRNGACGRGASPSSVSLELRRTKYRRESVKS